MRFDDLISEIQKEKARQMEKHHLEHWHDLNDDAVWLACLGEEFGEVAREVYEQKTFPTVLGPEKQKRELIQLITVASAWLCDEE
jgi:hypothetical protein